MYGKRDADYPSETAARRPLLQTRMHCDPPRPDEGDDEARWRMEARVRADARTPNVRGSLTEPDDQLKRFNEALREGLGGSQDI